MQFFRIHNFENRKFVRLLDKRTENFDLDIENLLSIKEKSLKRTGIKIRMDVNFYERIKSFWQEPK